MFSQKKVGSGRVVILPVSRPLSPPTGCKNKLAGSSILYSSSQVPRLGAQMTTEWTPGLTAILTGDNSEADNHSFSHGFLRKTNESFGSCTRPGNDAICRLFASKVWWSTFYKKRKTLHALKVEHSWSHRPVD
jgi:hypothetical protein